MKQTANPGSWSNACAHKTYHSLQLYTSKYKHSLVRRNSTSFLIDIPWSLPSNHFRYLKAKINVRHITQYHRNLFHVASGSFQRHVKVKPLFFHVSSSTTQSQWFEIISEEMFLFCFLKIHINFQTICKSIFVF